LRSRSREGKEQLVAEWIAEDTEVDHNLKMKFHQLFEGSIILGGQRRAWFRGMQFLLTWNGSWGVVPLAPGASRPGSLDETVAMLRQCDQVLALKAKVEATVERWDEHYRFQQHAWSIEMCVKSQQAESHQLDAVLSPTPPATQPSPESKDAEPLARVHVHCYINFGSRVQVKRIKEFAFMGSLPVISSAHSGCQRKRRQGNQGLYYVQAPKVGSLYVGGSERPFDTYLVNPDWVWSLLQTGKMAEPLARQQFVAIGKNLPRNLEGLAKLQQERAGEKLKVHMEAVRTALRGVSRPMRSLSPVSAWLDSFNVLAHRYKFLVLDGPSGMGKTLFARSLSPDVNSFFEVDCSGVLDPDLRQFEALRHTYVLFDECSPKCVLKNKKLFQASSSFVTLGASQTNMLAYQVWFHRVRIIVASNLFQQELQALQHADAMWVMENMVYVPVQQPLWEP